MARQRSGEPPVTRPGPMRGPRTPAWCALAALLLAGCATPVDPARRLATAAGLPVRIVAGDPFRHLLVERRTPAAAGARRFVFIEGDGRPFVAGGTRVAPDPTPARPLALELALRTPGEVVYLGRPCYHGLGADAGCTAALWTGARYSEAVVQSLAAAIRATFAAGDDSDLVLVGYSGGGTLAVLLAARLPEVRSVVTIAANLDVGAWARFHRYPPLTASLDPAQLAARPGGARMVHLIAGRDAVVPPALIAGYLAAHAGEPVGEFAGFDHACCWVDAWPAILADLAGWLDGRLPAPVAGAGGPQRAFSVSTARSSGG